VRFCLDEDLPPGIAVVARGRGLDILSSHECGRNSLPDEEQLRLATAEGRCLVTRNRDDLLRLTLKFFESEEPHAGVLIVSRSLPNRDVAGIVAALVAFADNHPDGVPSYTTAYLTREPR
jgi:hypothetical protein